MFKSKQIDHIITECLSTNYGIKAATLSFLPKGADINASMYKVQASDQTTYFIKIKQGHNHDIGIDIVELLHRFGMQQIIVPIKTIHGRARQTVGDFTLIVYPFVDGQDGFGQNLTDDQWIRLGKTLRDLHELEVPMPIQNQVRHETYCSKWRDALRSIYPHLKVDPINDPIAIKLHKFMKKKMSDIHRLVDRAEQLAERLKKHPLKCVLCHSDVHGGNVLIDKNSHFYIVDWDDPIIAPKERDLMFIGGGVGNVWNQTREEKLFYQGYGKTNVNQIALAYYRNERIVEDIAIYSQELLLSTNGGEDRQEMYRHFINMFQSQGVVDIAFKTDRDYS